MLLRALTGEESIQCVSRAVEELFPFGGKSSGNASNSSFLRREHLHIHQSANLLNCETKSKGKGRELANNRICLERYSISSHSSGKALALGETPGAGDTIPHSLRELLWDLPSALVEMRALGPEVPACHYIWISSAPVTPLP